MSTVSSSIYCENQQANMTMIYGVENGKKIIISTASGALVVGGVRDICSSMYVVVKIYPEDRFQCSME